MRVLPDYFGEWPKLVLHEDTRLLIAFICGVCRRWPLSTVCASGPIKFVGPLNKLGSCYRQSILGHILHQQIFVKGSLVAKRGFKG